jgi:hypothetical protein
MQELKLFGERALTLVAAIFDGRDAAVDAANALRFAMPRIVVDVVRPGDPEFARKIEREPQGIWRTALRSHAIMGPIGLALGAAVAAVLVASGWPAAASSPMFALLFCSILGLFSGLMAAGLVTLRPDRGRVIESVREGNHDGHWAVVAHPMNHAQSRELAGWLRNAGGQVVRSF